MKTTVIESMARAGDADVEAIILEWSKAGVFDEAGTAAIADAHSKGRSVTIIEDGVVYSFMPDGTKQELRRIRRSVKQYTSGKAYIS